MNYKKIKIENIFLLFYSIATLFKYFISANNNIIYLLFNLIIDILTGYVIYIYLLNTRKEL